MAENTEQTTEELDNILNGFGELPPIDQQENFSDYIYDMNELIKTEDKKIPQSWDEVDSKKVETFQKYAEQIPSLFNKLDKEAVKDTISGVLSNYGSNSAPDKVIAQQMSQVMQNIPQEQIGDVLQGINKTMEIPKRNNTRDNMLASLLQRDDLSNQNLLNIISCVQSKELLELFEQKLQKMPEAPEGSQDRMYQDKIKSRFNHKRRQIQTLESNTPSSQEQTSNTTKPQTSSIPGNEEYYWSEAERVKNSSKTDSDLQANMSSMMAQWQSKIGSLSPEEGTNMSLALYKIGMEDKNSLYTDHVVNNILSIASNDKIKDNSRMLQDVNDLVLIAQDDKQLSVVLSSIGNNMHLGKTGDKQTDFSGNLEKMLLEGMQSDKVGDRTLNVLATMLSNSQISEETRAALREGISSKYETLKNAGQVRPNLQEQIDGKLRRYDKKENVSSPEQTTGQRIGAKIGERIDNVIDGYQGTKQKISEKVEHLTNKGKAVHRLNRMKYNRNKEAIRQLYADAKVKASEFREKASQKMKNGAEAVKEAPLILAFGIETLVNMGYTAAANKINGAIDSVKSAIDRRINNVKNGFNRRVNNVKGRINNGVQKVKNFGRAVANGIKTTAIVTAYVAAAPVVLPYKAAKWGYKKISNGVKAISRGYKNLRKRALGITDEVAQNKDTAMKQSSSEKKVSRLNAEQVTAVWKQIKGDGNAAFYSKESDSYYNMSGYADKFLENINSGKTTLSKENAQLAASFLGISMEVQDKVNHNKVVDIEKRNRKIAEQLEQFGIKNPYKTEETKETEVTSQTPPAKETEKPKEPQSKEIPPLTSEQSQLVESQLKILKTLSQENGLKPSDDMYKGLADMMEKGFAEKGISKEQMNAIRENNPSLFPKEVEKPAPQPAPEKPKEAETPAPQPAPEKSKEAETPAPQQSKRHLSPEERAARYERKKAKKILQAQGRLKPKTPKKQNNGGPQKTMENSDELNRKLMNGLMGDYQK